jgi:hypothetical protein
MSASSLWQDLTFLCPELKGKERCREAVANAKLREKRSLPESLNHFATGSSMQLISSASEKAPTPRLSEVIAAGVPHHYRHPIRYVRTCRTRNLPIGIAFQC